MKIVLHELLVKDHNTVVFNLHGYTSNKELEEIVMFPDTSQFLTMRQWINCSSKFIQLGLYLLFVQPLNCYIKTAFPKSSFFGTRTVFLASYLGLII